ncbi:hypothetical protein WJX72_006070 [[Myrmecia] bisecta]|uniref:GATA-type domain-containing protein n=1 Tax=[Myrmecia] bisecta TaxID=41462 RepID=A0AAW1Q4E4_9CHLO
MAMAAQVAPRARPRSLPKRRGRTELHGPCCHCSVTESPQWRKGPKCKPVLCNACGTRFLRTRALGKVTKGGMGPKKGMSDLSPDTTSGLPAAVAAYASSSSQADCEPVILPGGAPDAALPTDAGTFAQPARDAGHDSRPDMVCDMQDADASQASMKAAWLAGYMEDVH